jgi:hypothetical protein
MNQQHDIEIKIQEAMFKVLLEGKEISIQQPDGSLWKFSIDMTEKDIRDFIGGYLSGVIQTLEEKLERVENLLSKNRVMVHTDINCTQECEISCKALSILREQA